MNKWLSTRSKWLITKSK